MKTVHKLGVIIGLSVATVAFATNATEQSYIASYHGRTGVPLPIKVVSPELAASYAGMVVKVGMVVDATGIPTDITVMDNQDAALVEKLTEALAQWRFAPALRDGQPMAVKVVVPIQIVDGSKHHLLASN